MRVRIGWLVGLMMLFAGSVIRAAEQRRCWRNSPRSAKRPLCFTYGGYLWSVAAGRRRSAATDDGRS